MYPAIHGGDLEHIPDDEDRNSQGEVLSSTEPVRRVCAKKGSKECADAQERDDQREDDRSECDFPVGLLLTETLYKVLEKLHAADLAGVEAGLKLSANRSAGAERAA